MNNKMNLHVPITSYSNQIIYGHYYFNIPETTAPPNLQMILKPIEDTALHVLSISIHTSQKILKIYNHNTNSTPPK